MNLPRREHPGQNPSSSFKRVRITGPVVQNHEDEILWGEVKKFADLIPSEPDPNFGRVREIKEELKKGTYFTREMIEETAARLAIRFMTKE
ncbi:MAG: hypothetical protein FGM27_00235 [Candidatus Omnitrophica bacterium]|nr:hypothetical protein [Candidatus Omnitrophota bacterium]